MQKGRWFGILLGIILLVVGITLFLRYLIIRYGTYGTPAADPMRTINVAEKQYKMSFPQLGYSSTLGELGPGAHGCPSPPTHLSACLIDLSLAMATSPAHPKSGYIYTYVAGPPNAQGIIESYSVHMDPVDERHGMNHYYTDETGVERIERDKPAGKESRVKEPD